MIGVCKFCGCTESAPCMIPASFNEPELLTQFYCDNCDPSQPCLDCENRNRAERSHYNACAWLLEDVCTAPECVAKAYGEACALIDQMLAGAGVGGKVHGVTVIL